MPPHSLPLWAALRARRSALRLPLRRPSPQLAAAQAARRPWPTRPLHPVGSGAGEACIRRHLTAPRQQMRSHHSSPPRTPAPARRQSHQLTPRRTTPCCSRGRAGAATRTRPRPRTMHRPDCSLTPHLPATHTCARAAARRPARAPGTLRLAFHVAGAPTSPLCARTQRCALRRPPHPPPLPGGSPRAPAPGPRRSRRCPRAPDAAGFVGFLPDAVRVRQQRTARPQLDGGLLPLPPPWRPPRGSGRGERLARVERQLRHARRACAHAALPAARPSARRRARMAGACEHRRKRMCGFGGGRASPPLAAQVAHARWAASWRGAASLLQRGSCRRRLLSAARRLGCWGAHLRPCHPWRSLWEPPGSLRRPADAGMLTLAQWRQAVRRRPVGRCSSKQVPRLPTPPGGGRPTSCRLERGARAAATRS